jgi:hypothetical protein
MLAGSARQHRVHFHGARLRNRDAKGFGPQRARNRGAAVAWLDISDDGRDEEEDRADAGAATAGGSLTLSLAAVICDGGEAGKLGNGFVGEQAYLRQFGMKACNGASGSPRGQRPHCAPRTRSHRSVVGSHMRFSGPRGANGLSSASAGLPWAGSGAHRPEARPFWPSGNSMTPRAVLALPDTWTAWTPGCLKDQSSVAALPHCFFGKVTTFRRSVSGVSKPSRVSGLGSELSLRNSMLRLRVVLVSLPNPAVIPIFRKAAAASRNLTLKAEGSRGQDRHRETHCSVRSPSVSALSNCVAVPRQWSLSAMNDRIAMRTGSASITASFASSLCR